MATQVALLGNVPEPFNSVHGLVRWQEAHRRQLLQSKRPDTHVDCLPGMYACVSFFCAVAQPVTSDIGFLLHNGPGLVCI